VDGATPAASTSRQAAACAGGTRPETDTDGELLKHQLNRTQMDKAVEAQLEHLKKKLGKEKP
jgi:hypothetical protein